jgi:hypothetical protein
MGKEMATENEIETGKTQMSFRLDAALMSAVKVLAADEKRSTTNMLERLLETHPQLQPILEGQSAEVAA